LELVEVVGSSHGLFELPLGLNGGLSALESGSGAVFVKLGDTD